MSFTNRKRRDPKMKKYFIAAVAALMLCSCGKVDLQKKNEQTEDPDDMPIMSTTTASTLSTSFYFPDVDEEVPMVTTLIPDNDIIDDEDEIVQTKKKKKTAEPEITIKPATVTPTVTTTTTTRATTTTTTKATTTTTTTTTSATTTTANNEEYNKKLEAAQKRLTEAKDALEKAKTAVTTAETAVTDSKAKQEQAEAALAAAKAAFPYAPNAYGFFESIGAVDALGVLDTATYADRTNMGGDGDATSLENIKRCFSYMTQCNQLRVAEGLPELMVTDRMMAIAMSNVNVSAVTGDHAKQFNVNECLKYGGGDPYGTWYESEKNPEINGGNYQNIVNPNFTVMGFGVNNAANCKLGLCLALIFSDTAGGSTYTVSSYETRFLSFYSQAKEANITGKEQAVTEAKAAVKKAEEAVEAAKTAQSKAEDELTAANVDLDNVKKEEPKNTQSGHRDVYLK